MACAVAALDAERAVTRPLRRAHFVAWMALAVVLAATFVAGLAFRRDPTPVNPTLDWERLR